MTNRKIVREVLEGQAGDGLTKVGATFQKEEEAGRDTRGQRQELGQWGQVLGQQDRCGNRA